MGMNRDGSSCIRPCHVAGGRKSPGRNSPKPRYAAMQTARAMTTAALPRRRRPASVRIGKWRMEQATAMANTIGNSTLAMLAGIAPCSSRERNPCGAWDRDATK